MVKQTKCVTSQIVSSGTFRNSTQFSSITKQPEVGRPRFGKRPPLPHIQIYTHTHRHFPENSFSTQGAHKYRK